MILEAIVTTRNSDGSTNIAPMGPHLSDVDNMGTPSLQSFELRPFQSSTTFDNLQRTGQGVLHVSDNVLLFAQAALNRWDVRPDLQPCKKIDCKYLSQANRFVEFQVKFVDTSNPRATMQCVALHQNDLRPFFGFNRAKHLVIEACILVTRIDFLPEAEIRQQFRGFQKVIQKTGGPEEIQAFQWLQDYLNCKSNQQDADSTDRAPVAGEK